MVQKQQHHHQDNDNNKALFQHHASLIICQAVQGQHLWHCSHLVLFEVGAHSPALVVGQGVSVLLEEGVDTRDASIPAVFQVLQGQTSDTHTYVYLYKKCYKKSLDYLYITALLASWLRRPPWERKTWGMILVSTMRIFPGRVITVTSKLALQWLLYNFYPSVSARTNVWADPSPRYTAMLLGC